MNQYQVQESKAQPNEIYFSNLDALRFLSFLSVFLFHSFHTENDALRTSPVYVFLKWRLFVNGNLGVNFFFVLSGFLITYLLLREKETFGNIQIAAFWKRRILRIWPVFYFCVLFGFFAFPLIKSFFGEQPNETAHLLAYVFFVNNFDLIHYGLPDASILSVLWSIAVEEQFYFVWPILMVLSWSRPYWIFIGVAGISILFRAYFDRSDFNEFHTMSCMGDMAIGGLGAWAVVTRGFDRIVARVSRVWIVLLYVAVLSCFLFRGLLVHSPYLFLRVVERPIIAMLFLFVILEQNYARRSFLKLGKIRLFGDLGRISYGLYCFHFLAILSVTRIISWVMDADNLLTVLLIEPVLSLLLTIALAWFSFRYFEQPFLSKKKKLTRVVTAGSLQSTQEV